MRRYVAGLLMTFAFACAAYLVSCARPYHQETERYVFVSTNINLPYWKQAEAGFLDAAQSLGVKAELVGPETYDPFGEITVFRKVVDQNPTGICLSAAKPELFTEEIEKAV
ncbi:MAG TPA: substrate-binding domain-containing protein, partial [Candidatus Acidoferrum sp.]|nr:substrate-binding domain-containing protein [Candidatus Acidoferrum sp.]